VGIAVVAILAWRISCRSEPEAALGEWVCAQCGAKERRPFEGTSPSCRACGRGQLVQSVFFRCTKCGAVVEGYQFHWSPNVPEAAGPRAEADADPARRNPDEDVKALIRRPGGPWAWTGSRVGLEVLRNLPCPNCGEGPSSLFEKLPGGNRHVAPD
jgi:DNA-directed RNA polymerase subunit RPC12/RpoP